MSSIYDIEPHTDPASDHRGEEVRTGQASRSSGSFCVQDGLSEYVVQYIFYTVKPLHDSTQYISVHKDSL